MACTVANSDSWFYDEEICQTSLQKLTGSISSLVFRDCTLKEEWKNLPSTVKKITTLKLDYTDVEGKVQGLANFVQRYHVQSLSLVNTYLQKEDLRIFYKELKGSTTEEIKLHSINFKFLELKPSGCEIIAKIVNLLPNVEELVLTNSDLDNKAIKKFLNTVHDGKAVKKLFLGENDGFTAAGMPDIGKLAQKCKVEEIELASCYLTDDHIKKLLNTLPKNVQSISLSHNPQLSVESIKCMLTKCKALQKIDISGHSFDNEQSNKLLQMFPEREIIGVEKTPDTQHTGDSSELLKHGALFKKERKVSDNYNPLPWIKVPHESSLPSSRLIPSR